MQEPIQVVFILQKANVLLICVIKTEIIGAHSAKQQP